MAGTDLASDAGVDYRKLRELLAAGSWKLADDETKAVMCKAAGEKQPATQVYLYPERIEAFPCADLGTIERLWAESSEGLFGFAAQLRHWRAVGGRSVVHRFRNMSDDEKVALGRVERAFAAEVGWTDQGPRKKIPKRSGHLPWAYTNCSYGYGVSGLMLAAMAWRLEQCGIGG